MKRGILSVLIALALCLTLLPATALAAEASGTCGDNLTWTLSENGTLTISYTGTGSGAMGDYLWDAPWESNKSSIKSVVIQDGVTSIGKGAFQSLNNVTSIEIPDSVASIGTRAFFGCSKLESIKLPASLTSIEPNTFTNCRALTSIEIPDSVRTIGDDAFNTTALTEVTIPEGVTSIGTYAFANCASLTTVEIPASVTTIGGGAFQGSTKAEILFKGTQEEWANAGGADSGASEDQLVINPHKVTIVGGEEGARGAGTYSEGAKVSIFAGTKDGYAFTGWEVEPEDAELGRFYPKEANTYFTMPGQDVTLTATWAKAVAELDGRKFADLQTAFDFFADPTVACIDNTVKLLEDVTVTEPISLNMSETKSVTLNGQGHTLTGTGSATISVKGGSLTLEDVTVKNTSEGLVVSPEYVIPGTAIHVEGSGNLTVSDGSAVRAEGKDGWALFYLGGRAHITIQGGTISGGEGFGFNTTGDFTADKISLLGGTFIGRTGSAVRVPSGFTLGDLVGEGLALINDDTKEAVAPTEEFTGPGTFTVGCGHASVGTVTASEPENGVVTVTGTCTKCNQEVTLGTLTMAGDGQTIIFGQAAQPFSVQASEGLTIVFYSWNNGTSTNTQYQPSVSTSGELKCPCEVTFKTPDNQEATANLEFTLTVRRLDITNAALTVGLVPDTSFSVPYNGQEQAPDVAKVLIDGKEFKYTLFGITLVDASGSEAAKQTNAGTYKIKLTGKDPLTGTQTLTSPVFTIEKAKPAIEWDANGQEYREYTGEPVAPATPLKVTVAGMDSYDGEAVTYSYTKEGETATQNGLPTNPGTYYIKAAVPQQKNYTAAGTETALKLIITKAAAKITVEPKAANPAYNGKPQALVTAAEASVGEVQYALSADGPWSASIPTATAPGEYTVWYKVDETANYTGVGAQSVKATIGKATAPDVGASLMVKNNQEKTYTLDLSPYLPALPQGQEYGELTYVLTAENIEIGEEDYIDSTTVELEGTVLTVPVNKVDKTDEGSVAVITVTIQSDNFQDIRLTVSVTATNKTPLIITGVTAQGWTYDGTVHPGYTGTPRAEGYTGEFLVTYLTGGDKQLKDAGTFSVVFTPMDTENYAGELQLPYTVEQAQVTVTADNKTATVGDELPELTYQVSGLAEGEELKTEPTPACDADMSKAGSYPITFSGAVLPDGGNYKAEIVYQNGTLTVSEKSAPPVNPDDLEIKLEVKEGFTEVPPALRALEHLNTPEKLTQVMRTQLTQTGLPEGNTAVYDVSLMVSNDGGQNWTPATPANFPSGGLTVTLPYPAGTDSTYQFTVVHMFTTTASGKIPGNTESPAVTNTAQGLQFTVTGLSPISVGWRAKTTGTGGSSGGGGGGSGASTYRVTVERTAHGKVTSNRTYAPEDSTVTLTAAPDSGYVLDTLTVTDSRGNKLQLTDKGGGKYAFTMSGGNVTVKAVFAPLADSGACDGGAACPSRAFTDLKSGAWYHEAVDFVLRSGLMNGYGNGLFGPEGRLSRAQFAQILYNKEGRPAGAASAPFTDVAADAWCAPAVAWAAERGIAGGYGGGLFGPDDPITREQLAVMLWRYAGSPAAPGGELSFIDAGQIGAHAREAICWAVESGVMSGKGGGVLDPKGLATRAQTAQMLKNFLENG